MLRRVIAAVVVAASSVFVVPAGVASADDVGSAKVVPVRVTGDPAKRFNIVILGDGYTEADMPAFREDVDQEVGTLFAFEPWKSYRSYVDVYRVEIVSGESGISCDPSVTSPRRDTPLGMRFCGGRRADRIPGLVDTDANAAARYPGTVAAPGVATREVAARASRGTHAGAGWASAPAAGGNALCTRRNPQENAPSLGGIPAEYNYNH